MLFRQLCINDYESYTTHINSNIDKEYFINFCKNILGKNQYIIVIEKDNNIIGSGTLLIEEKMTYGGSKLGHIENILINESERGNHLGKQLIDTLIELADINKCYRIDLICSDQVVIFYEKINFNTRKENAMSIILNHNFK